MMRDKKFILNAIKMDLFRVITATGDITKEVPLDSVKAFLEHADKDFDKINLEQREKAIRKDLKNLAKRLDAIKDPHNRLRWTEDVMTARCRL